MKHIVKINFKKEKRCHSIAGRRLEGLSDKGRAPTRCLKWDPFPVL